MAMSRFNFADRNASGKKKATMQAAISRRMAAQQPMNAKSAKEASAAEAEQAAKASRNKGVGR